MDTKMHEYDNSEKCARVENGQMHLQVHRSTTPGMTYTLPEGLCTTDTMNFIHGYLEMRARVPYRHGAWPSFWTTSGTVTRKAPYVAEIDIFEIFSDDRTAVHNLHKWGGGAAKHFMLPGGEGYPDRGYVFSHPETLNDEYHVYGFEWDEHNMSFYIDDVKYATVPVDESGDFCAEKLPGMEGFHEYAMIIINNEIFSPGSDWKPEGCVLTEDDPMPIDYYIDWVRLYQDPKTEKIRLKDEIAKLSEQ
jgi:hypothetical protein